MSEPILEPAAPAGGPRLGPERVAFATVGCKANLEEMECLASRLADLGYAVVPFGEPADWTIVNTCTVTGEGDSDSRQAVRRARRFSPEGRLVVTGCLAQRDPRAVASLPGVDWVLGNAEKPRLAEWLVEHQSTQAESRRPAPDPAATFSSREAMVRVSADPTVDHFAEFGGSRQGRRTRATLKVQDGCDQHCTFCVIPSVRGASRSRALDDTLQQARQLLDSGYREIMLTGINSALWGRDLAEPLDLGDLLHRLLSLRGLARLRLNSLEPQLVRDEWLALMAEEPRLCRHLHLPLQSGSDRVLKQMNRRYTTAEYAHLVSRVRALLPDCAIGADVMVGFPGETDRDFADGVSFLESLGLAYLHVFSYSERPGTGAPRLSEGVPKQLRMARSAQLRSLDARLRANFARSQEGRCETVLIEGACGAGAWQGLTGNYLRARFDSLRGSVGALHHVRLGALEPDGRIGALDLGPIPKEEQPE
ncbi:MAG: tRNA (N(6)-L-threonylcarbamoyladenosine(37)-C(2))-methylthiotransferase MtaB [Candidatus Eisenbacteria bacterium]